MNRTERGFILATTLLVMTMLTVMLTAALITVAAEYRSTNGSYGTSRALNFAQAGLQSYLSVSHTLSGTTDSVHYGFSGGYARVVARRMHDSTTSLRQLWIIYATGLDTSQSVSGSGSRTVAQLAYLETGTIPARAAMVALNGDSMVGSAWNQVIIDGDNFGYTCTGRPGGPAADTIGLALGGAIATAYYNGGGGPSSYEYPDGEASGATGSIESYSPTALAESTRIDWQKIVSGEYTPDYNGTFPTAGNTTYNTHYFSGNATIPAASSAMRGMLIVGGDVTLSAGMHWDGIILAGGRLLTPATGNFRIHGMIVTGLNITLGQGVGRNIVRRNLLSVRQIQWDWCSTRAVFGTQAFFRAIGGTFTDSWDTY